MNNQPIDYDSPLGISKREWVKVLGANLALLLVVYAIALVCTFCGSNLFLLNFYSEGLQRIEDTLRGWGVYPILAILFNCLETFVIATYVCKRMPRWYFMLGFVAVAMGANALFTQLMGSYPSFVPLLLNVCFVLLMAGLQAKRDVWWQLLIRFVVSVTLSLALNALISAFRTKAAVLWNVEPSSSVFYALNVEYLLALSILLCFLTLIVKWGRKGGAKECPTNPGAGGSSPNSTNSLPRNSKIAKTNLPPAYLKRLRWLKAKVIAIQTVALIVIAALPWCAGRPVEFALVYASFCLTRFMLGFNRSLHFKSELACVTIGALCFWALTFLTPSAEASIILSLCYGGGLALGFRLYWELHDLMMYHKAAKTDRYAMFYTVFRGNVSPKHVNGVMRAKGYADKVDITMVSMYMQRDKVEYIAEVTNYVKITVEKRLTEIASDLYAKR